jgi:hypothetical protein
MAKKKGGTGLAEAIRKAIEVHGPEKGRETTEAIRQFIRREFPGVDVEGASFGTALSGARKKAREADGTGVGHKAAGGKEGSGGGRRVFGDGTLPFGHRPKEADAVTGAAALLELQKLAEKVGPAVVKDLAKML